VPSIVGCTAVALRVEVSPEVLAWAKRRSRVSETRLRKQFPKLPEWELGERLPTLKQLEGFARATHTPVGQLLRDEPPSKTVPIPDHRTMRAEPIDEPSADLLDTIYLCQQRQDWYRGFAQVQQLPPVGLVGSVTVTQAPVSAAEEMRELLGFDLGERGSTLDDAFRRLSGSAEDAGVLVMMSGIVGSNPHRKLDPREFRGFALVDQLAPLVFVNGADTKAAKLFTLAHELAHLWAGETALSDVNSLQQPTHATEQWCNQVAAEFFVPSDRFAGEYDNEGQLSDRLQRWARAYKVSTLVILRRMHDLGFMAWENYREAYRGELARVLPHIKPGSSNGGDFYKTQPVRTSKRFARALVAGTLEGGTLFSDAYRMLGVKKHATFEELAFRLGVT